MNEPSPADLRRTLRPLRAQLRHAIARRLAWRAAAAVAAAAWGWLIIDRLFEPASGWRAAALGSLVLAAVVWLLAIALPRVVRTISDRQLLTLAHPHAPRDADLVATGLDLLERPSLGQTSPLREAAALSAREAGQRLAGVTLVRRAAENGAVGFAVVAVAGLLGFAIVRPDLAGVFAQRIAMSEQPWPRRVTLAAEGFEHHPATGEWRRHAPRGEPAEFFVTAAAPPGEKPPALVWARRTDLSSGGLSSLTRLPAPPDAGKSQSLFRRRVERLDSDQVFDIRGGDARLRLRLIATDRPQLVGLMLTHEPPAYLGALASTASPATLEPIPEGSRVELAAGVTKPLAAATAKIVHDDASTPSGAKVELADGGRSLRVDAGAWRRPGEVVIEGVDADGLALTPLRLPLEIQSDTPPSVSLAPEGVGGAITRDAVVGLVATIDDDHGLARLTIELSTDDQSARIDAPRPGRSGNPQAIEVDLLSLRSADPRRRLALEPGDRLRLVAAAEDHYDLAPREPTKSAPVLLEVVTESELLGRIGDAQRELRVTLDSLLSDVERIGYEADLRRRRLEDPEEPPVEGAAARWSGERQLDIRKAAAGVQAVADRADGLRAQVVNNRLDQAALVERLSLEVVEPLRGVVERRLDEAERLAGDADSADAVQQVSEEAAAAAETLRRVGEALDSQEDYNQVVSLLRDLIRDQRRVNQRTSQAESDKARSVLLDLE